LVIATPTATLAAIARAARGGVLFKGGQSIDQLANIGSVCMDKTGTLTYGRPHLYEVHPVAWSDGAEMLARDRIPVPDQTVIATGENFLAVRQEGHVPDELPALHDGRAGQVRPALSLRGQVLISDSTYQRCWGLVSDRYCSPCCRIWGRSMS
jgi:hypothetical protein